jgi:hypothetical protein
MLVLAVMSVLFLLVALWHSPRRRYGAYTLAAFAAYAVVFAYFLSFNTAVGFRSTYFKVPGMMMLPGIIVAVQRLQIRAVHWAGVALLVLTCLPGPYIAARNFQWRAALDVGIESFSLSASAELLEALRRIDNGWPARTALVQVGEPTWSLEIRNQRVFVGKAWNSGVSSIQKRIKHGVPAAAYVALPARAVEDGRADAVLSTYVDVKDWVSVGAGDAVIYYPRGQAGPDLGGLQHPGAQGSLTRDQ